MPKFAHSPAEVNGTVIGFDFGLKRIGVAIGQTITETASPLAIVASQDGKPDWTHISQLFAEWQPTAIVVGLPKRLNGEEQPLTQSARKFGQRLSGRYQRPVFFIDEQLSSIEAENRMKGQVAAHQPLDDHAAQIILENWLQQRNTQQRTPL
ncbi:Holliday junction resolvase RuvX [Galenea microaerophila]